MDSQILKNPMLVNIFWMADLYFLSTGPRTIVVSHFLATLSSFKMRPRPFESNSDNYFFQADHALYTPALDENRVSWRIVQGIWICYKVQFP